MAQTSTLTEIPSAGIKSSRLNYRIVLPITVLACFLCLSIGLITGFLTGVFYATSGKDVFSPRTTIYLSIGSGDRTLDSQQTLRDVRKTLVERSKILGYESISISKDFFNQNRIVVRLPKEIDPEKYISQVTAIGLIEFVDFGKEPPSVGELVHTDFDFPPLVVNEGPVRHTIITNQDIENASTRKDNQKFLVSFFVNPKGKEIIKEYTTQHTGSYLAVVLDKKVVVVPMVQVPITEGSLEIEGMDQEQANNLVAFLKTKPLPLELKVEK